MSNEYKLGDRVSIAPDFLGRKDEGSRVFTVSKVNPKNLILTPDDNQGPPVQAPPYALVPASAEDIAKIAKVDRTPVGTVVRVTKSRNIDPTTLYVVLSETAGKLKIAELGGAEGKFFPNIPHTAVKKVDLDPAAMAKLAQ
jgi:hypothetical protein